MLLPAVLFALVTVGFVVPCLIDVVATPGYEVRHLTRRTWVVLLIVFSVFGATAWNTVGRPVRYRRAAYRPRYLARTVGMAQRAAPRRPGSSGPTTTRSSSASLPGGSASSARPAATAYRQAPDRPAAWPAGPAGPGSTERNPLRAGMTREARFGWPRRSGSSR